MYTYDFLCYSKYTLREVYPVKQKTRYEMNSVYAKKYLSKMDDIKICVPSGEKAMWKAVAEQKGKSLNRYVIDLVHADMKDIAPNNYIRRKIYG